MPKSGKFNGDNSIVFKIVPSITSIKNPVWHQRNYMWLRGKMFFFFLQAVMGSRKRLTMNQLCFSSTVDINYDNLDILAVKPKKQENHHFQAPAKVKFVATQLKGRAMESDLKLISGPS